MADDYFERNNILDVLEEYTEGGQTAEGLQIIAAGNPEAAEQYVKSKAFLNSVELYAYDGYSSELTYFISNASLSSTVL